MAKAWAVNGVFEVIVAAGAGWLVSRRLTRPILHLAEVTGRMAQGDLSVRAQVDRDDELPQLVVAHNHMAGRVENTVLSLRRFVGDAAHQLLTPLTALCTSLELEGR